MPASGASSEQRVRAINPDAYIVAEIWREKPEWLTGDTFDALMNYPLAETLLSFAAARQLDMDVLMTQDQYRDFVRPIDGPELAARLEQMLMIYPPRNVESMLNLLGSHDTPRFVTLAGGDIGVAEAGNLGADDLARRAVHLLRRRDRHAGPPRSRFHGAPSRGMSRTGITSCWTSRVPRSRCATAKAVLRHGEFRTLAAEGQAIAYLRSAPDSAVVVVLNAGDAPATLSFALDAGAALVAHVLPGWRAATIEQDGSMVGVTVAPRSGAVLLGVGA